MIAAHLLWCREEFGHELVERRIDVQIDADKADHPFVAVMMAMVLDFIKAPVRLRAK